MSKTKRIIALLLVCLILTAFAACQKSDGGGSATTTTRAATTTTRATTATTAATTTTGIPEGQKLFAEPTTISYMLNSTSTYNYEGYRDRDWHILKYLEEKTNVVFDLMEFTDANAMNERFQMAVASRNVPDMVNHLNLNIARQYGPQGLFVNVLDNIDKLPAFDAWQRERRAYLFGYISGDGNLYTFPNEGIGGVNQRGWMYRKDIFDKHNLSVPTTDEELYNVLKALKELYPNSYPLGFLYTGANHMSFLAASWGAHFDFFRAKVGFYYDEKSQEFKFGATEDNLKELVVYLNKLHSEGLIPMDFNTMAATDVISMLVNSESFVCLTFLTYPETVNRQGKEINQEFNFIPMAPIKGGTNGSAVMTDMTLFQSNITVTDNNNKDNTLKFVDWLYTEEGMEAVTWGEEDVTFTKAADGTKSYIGVQRPAVEQDLRLAFGIAGIGTYLRFDMANVFNAIYPDYYVEWWPKMRDEYNVPANFASLMPFGGDNYDVDSTVGADIDRHCREMYFKFILGQRSIDEWDEYVQEVKNLGLDRLKAAYENQYEMLKGMGWFD